MLVRKPFAALLLERCFHTCKIALWRLCAGDLKVCRFSLLPVRQPAYNCHPSFGDE